MRAYTRTAAAEWAPLRYYCQRDFVPGAANNTLQGVGRISNPGMAEDLKKDRAHGQDGGIRKKDIAPVAVFLASQMAGFT